MRERFGGRWFASLFEMKHFIMMKKCLSEIFGETFGTSEGFLISSEQKKF